MAVGEIDIMRNDERDPRSNPRLLNADRLKQVATQRRVPVDVVLDEVLNVGPISFDASRTDAMQAAKDFLDRIPRDMGVISEQQLFDDAPHVRFVISRVVDTA